MSSGVTVRLTITASVGRVERERAASQAGRMEELWHEDGKICLMPVLQQSRFCQYKSEGSTWNTK